MDKEKAVVSPLLNKIIGVSFTVFGCVGSLIILILSNNKGRSLVILIPLIMLIGGLILMAISEILDNQKKLDKKLSSLNQNIAKQK